MKEVTQSGVFKVRTDYGAINKLEVFAYRTNSTGLTEVRWLPHGKASTFHNWKVGSIPNGAEIVS